MGKVDPIPRQVALIQSSDEIKELLRKRFLHELIVHCSQIGSDVALGRRTEDWAGLFTGSGERKGLQRGAAIFSNRYALPHHQPLCTNTQRQNWAEVAGKCTVPHICRTLPAADLLA